MKHIFYTPKCKRNIKERKLRKRGGSSQFRGRSREQDCVLIARDRQKATYPGVLGRGRLVKTQLHTAIGSKLSPDNTLFTEAWRAFSTYAKSKDLEHYRFKSDGIDRVRGISHIQNVNNNHSSLKGWIQRFNGVATKYLDHYLSWFQFLDIVKHRSDDGSISKMVVDSCLLPINETYSSLGTYQY